MTTAAETLTSDCVALPAAGPPDSMIRTSIDVPAPGTGEVRIEVEACGLNPVDWKVGESGVAGWTWPHVLGLDIVGCVESVGPGGDQSLLGSRVAVHHNLAKQGGLARFVVVDLRMCCNVPERLDSITAAAVPCPGLTAAQAVDRCHVRPGDRTLVIGAGGSVGTFATQLAVAAGGVVTAVAGARDAERLGGYGITTLIDYRSGPLPQIAPGPFDVVLDAVGAPGDAQPATLLAYCGRMASVSRPDLSLVAPFTTSPTVAELALGAVYSHGSDGDLRRTGARLAELLRLVTSGSLQVPPISLGGLAEAPTLLQAMADHRLAGKVVIDVSK